MFRALVFLVLTSAALMGAPPDSPFTFPNGPVVPPAPLPPAPNPAAVPLLAPDCLYVVSSKVDAVARAHPEGIVKITKETGPIRIRGKFIDGDKPESRVFPGPFVFVIESTGKGRVELDFIPLGLKLESEIVTKTLDVDQLPIPPPKPKPDPDPVVKVEKVWVFVIEDAAAPRTAATAKALNDPFWQTLKPRHDWRHYLSTSQVAISNGYVEAAKSVGYPAVLVMDDKERDIIKKFKLATVADVDAAVKEVTK